MSPDGCVFWMRAVHKANKLQGVYLPREVVRTLGWTYETVLQLWIQGDVVCLHAMPDQTRVPQFTPQPPKSWKEHDRENQISIFEGVK